MMNKVNYKSNCISKNILQGTWKIISKILPYLPKEFAHQILFFRWHRYFLDLNNPKTYDEKLTYAIAKLIGKREAIYADKYLVRSYIEKMGFGEYLPKIYGVWNNVADIDFNKLPNQFVLKTNHGSGKEYYLICKDKNTIDCKKVRTKFERALKTTIWKTFLEYHYKYISPLVFAEEYLDDGIENYLIDYKVHCFDGKAECILVCSNRGNDLKLDYYDLNWNYLDIVPQKYRSRKIINKPDNLDEMIYAAEKISAIFPAARIDFYDVHGKIYFGEITLTPAGGHLYYINDTWQKFFGNKINFSKCKDSFVIDIL